MLIVLLHTAHVPLYHIFTNIGILSNVDVIIMHRSCPIVPYSTQTLRKYLTLILLTRTAHVPCPPLAHLVRCADDSQPLTTNVPTRPARYTRAHLDMG
jgi:hypothetical protein